MTQIRAAITAVNGWVPEYVLTNDELSTIVDTNDEWIMTRTGIKERRILKEKGKATSDMAAEAVKGLLKKRGISPEEIELIIISTITPDMTFPNTASLVCHKAGLSKAWGFDLNAACCGFMFGLETATQFVTSGKYKKVILVGADMMSSITDYTDRSTCVLFGDAASAVLLEPTTDDLGVIDTELHVDGAGAPFLNLKAGGSLRPASHETINNKEHYLFQDGQPVFKAAVKSMADATEAVMKRNNLTGDDIAWLVPHQANKRIIDATAHRAGLTSDKVMLNIHKYGNTTAATIPLCLWEWEKQLKKGDNLIIAAFGGGFTWGAIFLKWAYDAKQ